MKKQSLIHLHELFAEVRHDLESRGKVPTDAFIEYEVLGVPPTAIHRSKDTQKEAIDRILTGLSRSMGEDELPTVAQLTAHD